MDPHSCLVQVKAQQRCNLGFPHSGASADRDDELVITYLLNLLKEQWENSLRFLNVALPDLNLISGHISVRDILRQFRRLPIMRTFAHHISYSLNSS